MAGGRLPKISLALITPSLDPALIGHFSIDGDLQYRTDLSQLKYYIPPSNPEDINLDLNINLVPSDHKPASHIKWDNLLRWISEHFDQIERPLLVQKSRWYVEKSLSFKTS